MAPPEKVLIYDVVVDQGAVVDQFEGEERVLSVPIVSSCDLGAESADYRSKALSTAHDGVLRWDPEDGVDFREA